MKPSYYNSFLIALLIFATVSLLTAQTPPAVPVNSGQELRFVVIVSRHGVRSPTGKIEQLNEYSAQPWPTWSVPPGYLTAHGAQLMTLMGTYDRELLTREGLFASGECSEAEHISILADSDQRTRESGKALAEGLFPNCSVAVHALAEGTQDPLFHPSYIGGNHPDKLIATAAIAGRIGNNPSGLVEAYRPQLQAMEEVLTGCKVSSPYPSNSASHMKSLFDIPTSISPGKGDHLVDLRSPLATAATMAENLLLEYTEDKDKTQVGWGCVDISKLRELMQLHTANADIERRTEYIARAQSSNLLAHILDSMQQAVTETPVSGALSKPADRLLVLVGHDTNLANISGALSLSWLTDGRRDDTPPGGALVFELWRDRAANSYSVRTFYMAQTLDQMRNSAHLDAENPPERVPVFVPACGRADSSCGWESFSNALKSGIYPEFVK